MNAQLLSIERAVRRIESKVDFVLTTLADMVDAQANDPTLRLLGANIRKVTAELTEALSEAGGVGQPPARSPRPHEGFEMNQQTGRTAPPVIQQIIDDVARLTAVKDSVVLLLNSVPALIQSGIDAAIGNGATAEELAPLTQAKQEFEASIQQLADAVTQNTPTDPNG